MSELEVSEAIVEKVAITELIHRSCRGIDRMDKELAKSVWHADSVADFSALGGYCGDGYGYVEHATAMHSHMEAHMHLATNILIDLDGDRAASETCIFVTLQHRNEDKLLQYSTWCRYLDQWSKRGGRWGIDKRLGVADFDEVREVTRANPESTGRRDRSDPSYLNFASCGDG